MLWLLEHIEKIFQNQDPDPNPDLGLPQEQGKVSCIITLLDQEHNHEKGEHALDLVKVIAIDAHGQNPEQGHRKGKDVRVHDPVT